MTFWYKTRNLVECFNEDCPLVSKIPIVSSIAFKIYVKSYYKHKLPLTNS